MVTRLLKINPHSFEELFNKLSNEFTKEALGIELETLISINSIRLYNGKYYINENTNRHTIR